MNLKTLVTDKSAKIIDVRTPAEFMGGHVAGSKNIPLNELPAMLEEFRTLEGPVILCCASGNRSGQAEMFLRQNGVADVFNGGSWLDVNYALNN